MGAYPLALHNLNYAKRSFDVIFYAWWLSEDKNYDPAKMLEMTNAYESTLENEVQNQQGNLYRTTTKYHATIHKNWDLKNFPFDRQTLRVDFEDSFFDENVLELIPDDKNSRIASNFELQDWQLVSFKLEQSKRIYDSNFGDTSIKQSTFSQLSLVFDIKRQGVRIFFDYFIGFFLAFLLCCIAYMEPLDVSAKFSLSLAAVFAFMGNKYIMDNYLPTSPDFTLSDKIQMATFIYIIMTVLMNAIENILAQLQRITFSRKVSLAVFVCATSAYLLFVGIAISHAIIS